MKKTIAFAFLASSSIAAIVLAGCSSGDNGNPADSGTTDATATDAAGDAGGGDSSSGQDAAKTDAAIADATVDSGSDTGVAFPAPPALGIEIDRLGRPAVNTALDHVFDPNTTTKNAAKDTYNADNMTANWTSYVSQFESNLAIYDGLDTKCGNQVAYTDAGAYTTLATVLSADALWLNTGTTTCNQYLGVEIKVLDPTAPTDCGGRTLTENVVDTTYNAVAGTFNPSPDAGVSQGPLTNGITAPAAGQVGNGTFPYLAPPHVAADAGAPEDSGAADTGAQDAGADGAIRDAAGE